MFDDRFTRPVPVPTGAGIELAHRADDRMLVPARRAGYELQVLGTTALPEREVVVQTQQGQWLFVDHVADPTAEQYRGRIPIPAEQRSRLMDLACAGVRPDVVWLGHELPDGWHLGDRVPVPVPKHLRYYDERLARRLQVMGKALLSVGGGLVAAAAAPLALAAAAGAGLDPIVVGGVRHPVYPVVQWVLLAQWAWE